jgi:DNA-binding NarL/FixJ family response regulator
VRVCIVGASGKLGQYMVQHVLDRGYEVVGVCREESVRKLDAFKGGITVVPAASSSRTCGPSNSQMRCAPSRRATPSSPALAQLTERKLDVLVLVARGLSNSEIASALFLTEATVKTHLTHILTKLDLCDRIQAVVLAYESGLIQPGEPTRPRGMEEAPS